MTALRLAAWTLLLLAGCGAHEKPRPVSGKASSKTPVAIVVPTAAPAEEIDDCPDKPTPVAGIGAGGPWVGFFARPYDPEPGPSQGASWTYSAPGLPAISKDGTRLLLYNEQPLLFGETGRERLETLRASDEKILSTRPLRFGDLRTVEEAGEDPARIGRAYDDLAREAAQKIEGLNAQITAKGWSSLVPCRIDIQPGETTPACSMKSQEIRCGDWLSATYEEPRLELSVPGKNVSLQRPKWRHAPEPSNEIPVNGCLDSVYYHPAHAVLLLHIDYECQLDGDWCVFPGVWHVVKLPVAPGADEPRSAPGSDCPAGMAAIPPGSVVIGPPEEEPRKRRPAPPVPVGAACLDTQEVTVADYAGCVKAGRCFSPDLSRWQRPSPDETPAYPAACNWGVAGRERHPMNCVPWSFATQYCASLGKRLPSEREWQWAVTGSDACQVPFARAGVDLRTDGVCWNRARDGTCATGASARDVGPFGTVDMAGNVSEWTSSDFQEHDACWSRGGFVIRGSNYQETRTEDLRGARRRYAATSTHEPWLGFRCARDRTP